MPNPWASGGGTTATPRNNASNTTTPGTTAPADSTAQNNSSAFSGMLQGLLSNSGAMQNLLNTPYTQNLLESLSNNPSVAQELLRSNPLFANNPQMQEQLRAMTPTLLSQLRDPEFQNVLSNPAAIQAIMQIQQGIEQLRVAAPNFAQTYAIFLFNRKFYILLQFLDLDTYFCLLLAMLSLFLMQSWTW